MSDMPGYLPSDSGSDDGSNYKDALNGLENGSAASNPEKSPRKWLIYAACFGAGAASVGLAWTITTVVQKRKESKRK